MIDDNLVETYVLNGDYLEALWSSANLKYYFSLFKKYKIRVSGGDVYQVINNETVPTGDNWTVSQKDIDNGKSYSFSGRFISKYEKQNRGKYYYALSLIDEMNHPIYLSKEHPVACIDDLRISNVEKITIRDSNDVTIRAKSHESYTVIINFKKVYDFQMMSIENCYSRIVDSSDSLPQSDLLFIQESNRVREMTKNNRISEVYGFLKEYCIMERGERVIFVITPDPIAVEYNKNGS